jgi:hypothetical protein
MNSENPIPDTKVLGDIRLDFAFELRARYEAARLQHTPKGQFRYQDIVSGAVTGGRLKAKVYPNSGGQYDTVRPDQVRDVDAHFILNAENGERLYVEHFGYRASGGYYRAIAFLDADTKGAYDWVNDTTFVVTAQESPDEHEVLFTYYVAN